VEIELVELPTRMSADQLIDLDDALDDLEQQDPVKARLVTLRYFGGMTIEQADQWRRQLESIATSTPRDEQ